MTKNSFRLSGETKKGTLFGFLLDPVSKKEEFPAYLQLIHSDGKGHLTSTDGKRLHQISVEEDIPEGCYIPEVTKKALFLTKDEQHQNYPAYDALFNNAEQFVPVYNTKQDTTFNFLGSIFFKLAEVCSYETLKKEPITFNANYLQSIFNLDDFWSIFCNSDDPTQMLKFVLPVPDKDNKATAFIMPIKLKG